VLATPLGNQKHPSLKVIINSLSEPSCAYQQEMQLWRGHQQVEAAERFIMSRVNERYTPKEITSNPHLLIPLCTLPSHISTFGLSPWEWAHLDVVAWY